MVCLTVAKMVKFSMKDYCRLSGASSGQSSAILIVVLVVALACCGTVYADGGEDVQDLDKVLFRPRLGHFADTNGFLDAFVAYFDDVIVANDRAAGNLPDEHWRRYRPTGDLCLNFLHGFKEAKGYTLNKPFDIIPLDACLNWLYDESSEKQLDLNQLNKVAQGEAAKLAKDNRLRDIYESTHFKDDSVPFELKKSLFNYLVKLLQVNAANPRNGCHGLWLEGYTDFIEDVYLTDDCEDDDDCVYFGWPEAAQDSYLKLIVDSTKTASKNCYKIMQKQLKGLMNRAYMEEPKMTRHFISSKAAKQSDSMKWGREMMRILQLVTGTDPENSVDLGNVMRDLNKLKHRDEATVERFTEGLGQYAIQNVDLKDSANDPTGRARYGRAMVKLCRPYINEKLFLAATGGVNLWEDPTPGKKPFEFYSIVYGLVRLTNHESFYGVSKAKFEEDVIQNGWESLYLATFTCQLISSTYAELNYDTSEPAFDVSFREAEQQILIDDWPIELITSRLTKDGAGSDASRSKSGATSGGSRGLLGFGLKFSLGKQKNNRAPPAAAADDEETPAPAPKVSASGRSSGNRQKNSAEPDSQASEPEAPASGRRIGGFGISLRGARNKKPQEPVTEASKPVETEPPVAQETAPVPSPPAATAPPPPAAAAVAPAPAASRPKVPSLENILMFRELHGRYPSGLPANIHEIYPQLPKNLDGDYPKKAAVSAYNRPVVEQVAKPKLSDMRVKKQQPTENSYADRRSKFAPNEKPKPSKPANKWASVNTI